MNKSIAFDNMQRAILIYIDANIPKDNNKAHFGTVSGKRVIIGNRAYNFEPVVDSFFGDGDRVCCIVPDSGYTAAVVGV